MLDGKLKISPLWINSHSYKTSIVQIDIVVGQRWHLDNDAIYAFWNRQVPAPCKTCTKIKPDPRIKRWPQRPPLLKPRCSTTSSPRWRACRPLNICPRSWGHPTSGAKWRTPTEAWSHFAKLSRGLWCTAIQFQHPWLNSVKSSTFLTFWWRFPNSRGKVVYDIAH